MQLTISQREANAKKPGKKIKQQLFHKKKLKYCS